MAYTKAKMKKMVKKQKAAVHDEMVGAKAYDLLAKEEKEAGHPGHVKTFKSHAKDERRHKKEDAKIARTDKNRMKRM
jgi:rubrerythrin